MKEIKKVAAALGLDMKRFAAEMNSAETNAAVQEESKKANKTN